MAISREEAAGGRVPRWDERARGAFAGMWCNISYTALSSATSATTQTEGSNAHLGYFMKVAGDRGDVQTGLIKYWFCRFWGQCPDDRWNATAAWAASLIMRALSWPISATSEWRQGLNLDSKVNDNTAKVTKPRTVQNIYLGSRGKIESHAECRKTRSQQPECDTSGGEEAEPTVLFALPH